ncbi:hypothetical protein BC941DRAFT_474416 [Chlamydoabsidia padenii]|nr:hypothetical protein BC941DRAFT_474416 [Chlamydoabsidia padenii]
MTPPPLPQQQQQPHQHEDPGMPSPQQNPLSGSREAMEPLYQQLLQQSFPDSHSAIEFCRHACAGFGFTIKQEASANRNIYVYCSREGLPDSQRKPKPTPQRKRPSKRCDCRWRVVLSENNQGLWEFRKASSTTAYEHNHDMMDPKDMVRTWPMEVNTFIIQLARQRMQTHEIRDIVKQRFPDITWNERRFYNRLTEERKRIRQRDVMDRVQRLLHLSAKLCSVVAAHDDWFGNVESDLMRVLDHYYHLSRLPPESSSALVDFPLDQITMDLDQQHYYMGTQITTTPNATTTFTSGPADKSTSSPSSSSGHHQYNQAPALLHHRSSLSSDTSSTSFIKTEMEESPAISTKKRKSMLLDTASSSPPPPISQQQQQQQQPKGTHTIYIPPFTIYVRPQHFRPMSESTSPQQQIQQHYHQQQLHHHHHHQQQQRFPYADSLSSPSAMMDVTSPHPNQALSFNNPSLYSLTSPSSSSVSSYTSSFQQQQKRPSSTTPQQQSLSGTTTSNTSSATFQNGPPSDHTHQPFYMPTEPFNPHPHQQSQHQSHHYGNDGGGSGNMRLQQATQTYSLQSFNNYNPNTTASADPNQMSFFDHSSLLTNSNTGTPPLNATSSGTHRNTNMNRQQQEAYRSMMDITTQQQQQQQHRASETQSHAHDGRATISHSSSNPLFMYSTQLPGDTGAANVDSSVPMAMHTLSAGNSNIHGLPPTPSTSFHQHQHHKKGSLFDTHQQQQHTFSTGQYSMPPHRPQEMNSLEQQTQQSKSPSEDDVMMDDSTLP